jgi:ferric-dicitrate binding protein FerR (iron transport regulator)
MNKPNGGCHRTLLLHGAKDGAAARVPSRNVRLCGCCAAVAALAAAVCRLHVKGTGSEAAETLERETHHLHDGDRCSLETQTI